MLVKHHLALWQLKQCCPIPPHKVVGKNQIIYLIKEMAGVLRIADLYKFFKFRYSGWFSLFIKPAYRHSLTLQALFAFYRENPRDICSSHSLQWHPSGHRRIPKETVSSVCTSRLTHTLDLATVGCLAHGRSCETPMLESVALLFLHTNLNWVPV